MVIYSNIWTDVYIFYLFYFQAIPKYVLTVHGNIINTKYETAHDVVVSCLSSGIFIAGFIGFILDNTIPGILFNYLDKLNTL